MISVKHVLAAAFVISTISPAFGQEDFAHADSSLFKQNKGNEKLMVIGSELARAQGTTSSLAGVLAKPNGTGVVTADEITDSNKISKEGKKELQFAFEKILHFWQKQGVEFFDFCKNIDDLNSQKYKDRLKGIQSESQEVEHNSMEVVFNKLTPLEREEVCRVAIKKSINSVSSDFVSKHLEIPINRSERLRQIFSDLSHDFRLLPKKIIDKRQLISEIKNRANIALAECYGALDEDQLSHVARLLEKDSEELLKSLDPVQHDCYQREKKRWEQSGAQ